MCLVLSVESKGERDAIKVKRGLPERRKGWKRGGLWVRIMRRWLSSKDSQCMYENVNIIKNGRIFKKSHFIMINISSIERNDYSKGMCIWQYSFTMLNINWKVGYSSLEHPPHSQFFSFTLSFKLFLYFYIFIFILILI